MRAFVPADIKLAALMGCLSSLPDNPNVWAEFGAPWLGGLFWHGLRAVRPAIWRGEGLTTWLEMFRGDYK